MYIYHYVDYLDNVRVSYYNSANVTTILEENNYYPFGLRQNDGSPENLYNAGEQGYSYKYNGKELQTDSGMLDYGARFYMPEIGRWGVVDPLAEQSRRFTPYHYGNNDPVRFIDPDGRSAMDSYYDYFNFSNDNRPMFSTDGKGGMDVNSLYLTNSLMDENGQGGGGGLFANNPMNSLSGTITEWLENAKIDMTGKTNADKKSIEEFIKKVPELEFLYNTSGKFEIMINLLIKESITKPETPMLNIAKTTFGSLALVNNLQLGIHIIHEAWHSWDIKMDII